ncbi:MAG: hypothetical protein ACJ77E_06230 [Gaiellaceae bacterium]
MARWVLNTFSTAELVVFGVGGAVVLTIVCVLLLRRRFPRLADSEFEPVADSLRVVYELIFALILAFVIASVLDEMGNAEAAVASEATTISELVRANDALPPRVGGPLDTAVDKYVHAVANDEWKTMKDGGESAQANAELEGMYAEYDQVKPKGAAQTAVYAQALDDLHDVTSKRRERLNIAASDQPTMLRVLVVVGLVLLLVLEYRPHLKPVAGLVFMGTLAAVVTSAFLLTVLLDYPFAGQVAVSNEPFKEDNLARFWSTELAYRSKPGDEAQPLTAQRLQGLYNSIAYGTLVLRCYDDDPHHTVRRCRPGDRRMRGVYRYYDGTITGEVVGDVFRGWWTQAPTHRGDDAGRVALRLVKTSDGPLVAGSYGTGFGAARTPGWDLKAIGGDTPPDLDRRLHDPRAFIEAPHAAT